MAPTRSRPAFDISPPPTDTAQLLWPRQGGETALALRGQKSWPGMLALALEGSPACPVEDLYRRGYKVLLANIDPLPLLVVEARLTDLDQGTLREAFRQLEEARKGDQPLHQHLGRLYRTTCPHCQTAVKAAYFVWQRDPADPQQKAIRCPRCGFTGLASTTPADFDHLDRIETRGVHYHFLLGRTIAANVDQAHPLRARLERLHELYTPRALYAIAEILMKLETVIEDKAVQRVFKAILLNCLPAASNLFAKPAVSALPKRLRPPRRFIEFNVWRLFRRAVAAWPLPERPTRITPRIDDFLRQRQSSVHLFPDEAAHLRRYLADESVSLATTILPDPDPAAWALSTLWSGWLLGLKAAERSHARLTQRWPDWGWYQAHLVKTFRPLRATLKPEARWPVVVSAAQRLHPPAVILAALRAGFEVDEWEITATDHVLSLVLPPPDLPPPLPVEALRSGVEAEIRDTVSLYRRQHPQPVSREGLVWAGWQSLLYSGWLAQALTSLPARQLLLWLDKQIENIVSSYER